MKFRIRHAEKVVGAFVFLALILVVVLVVLIGMNQRWFQRNYVYHSHFLTANSLSAGTVIQMKGFEVGRISRVTLNEQNTVDVDLYIYETYKDRITRDSVLDLVTSPIGLGSSLLLYRGLEPVLLAEGSDIPSVDYPEGKSRLDKGLADVPPKDDTVTSMLTKVNDILDRLYQNVDVLWKTWIGEYTQGPKGSLGANLASLQTNLDNLQPTVLSLQHLMANVDTEGSKSLATVNEALPKTLESVEASLGSVQSSLAQVNNILNSVATMADDLKGTTSLLKDPQGLAIKLIDPKGSLATLLDDKNDLWNRVGKMLDNVQGMTDDLKKTTSGVADQVPKLSGLIIETRDAVAQAKDVLEGLKNNPLLKGGIAPKTEQQTSFQSLRQEDF